MGSGELGDGAEQDAGEWAHRRGEDGVAHERETSGGERVVGGVGRERGERVGRQG